MQIDPAASVLHYGLECFEGRKRTKYVAYLVRTTILFYLRPLTTNFCNTSSIQMLMERSDYSDQIWIWSGWMHPRHAWTCQSLMDHSFLSVSRSWSGWTLTVFQKGKGTHCTCGQLLSAHIHSWAWRGRNSQSCMYPVAGRSITRRF